MVQACSVPYIKSADVFNTHVSICHTFYTQIWPMKEYVGQNNNKKKDKIWKSNVSKCIIYNIEKDTEYIQILILEPN